MLAFFFFLGTSVLLSELPLLATDQRTIYAVVKSFFLISLIPLGFWLWKDYTSVWPNTLLGVIFMGYSIHGQWYRPLYYFAVFQLGMGLSILFAVPRRIFRPLLTVWSCVFLGVLYLRWDQYQEQIKTAAFSDVFFAILVFAALAIVNHTYITTDRMFRETALAQFSRMGLQASRLIHDLKGLTASPKLYAEMITEKLADKADPQLTQALEALSRDLENLNRIVVELNQLTTVAPNKIEDFKFSMVLDSTRAILGGRLRNVRLESSVCARLHSDSSMLSSILLNLFLNSMDNFKKNQTGSPEIRISAHGRSLVIEDNGGGFAPEVLKGLTLEKISSTKPKGTGLGLWFVLDGMQNLGGKAKMYNGPTGACVELVFPRGVLSLLSPGALSSEIILG